MHCQQLNCFIFNFYIFYHLSSSRDRSNTQKNSTGLLQSSAVSNSYDTRALFSQQRLFRFLKLMVCNDSGVVRQFIDKIHPLPVKLGIVHHQKGLLALMGQLAF